MPCKLAFHIFPGSCCLHNPLLGGNKNQIRDNVIYSNCLKMSRRSLPIIYLNQLIMGGYEKQEIEKQGEGLAERRRQGRKRHPLQCCRLIIFCLDGRPRSTPGWMALCWISYRQTHKEKSGTNNTALLQSKNLCFPSFSQFFFPLKPPSPLHSRQTKGRPCHRLRAHL